MKKIVYMIICSLALLFFASCERRPLTYDYQSGFDVKIIIDWSGIEDKSTLMKAQIFPLDGGRAQERLIDSDGGVVKVEPNDYYVTIHSWDTRSIKFSPNEDYSTYSAYTDIVTNRNGVDEFTIFPPDKLYSYSTDKFTVIRSDTENVIRATPKGMVKRYEIFVAIKGIEHVSNFQLKVDGVSQSILLSGENIASEPSSNIIINGKKGEHDGTSGSWSELKAFNVKGGSKVQVLITTPDGKVTIYDRRLPDEISQSIPIILEVVEVEYEPEEGGGGFNPPEIGDWDDVEVVVPL